MISGREAVERLRPGNQRFASGVRSNDMLASQTRRTELAAGQEPFAIILGCSDSRVPAEMSSTRAWATCLSFVLPETSSLPLKSAASSWRPSVSVHRSSSCWATRSAALFWPHSKSSCGRRKANREICARSSTASDPPWKSCWRQSSDDPDALVRQAVRSNVRVSSNHLRHGSEVLEQLGVGSSS